MTYYRKKPVVIEAMQWDGSWDSMDTINARWPNLETTHLSTHNPSRTVRHWGIGTLEGHHEVSKGDFIIKGVKGEFYPYKPDIFAMTYEIAASQGELVSKRVALTDMGIDKMQARFNLVTSEERSHYGDDYTVQVNDKYEARKFARAIEAHITGEKTE